MKVWKKLLGKAKPKDSSQSTNSNITSALSTASPSSNEVSAIGLRERLWNEAFDGLEVVDADTVKQYKEILLKQLKEGQLQNAPFDPTSATNEEIRAASNGRWQQMEQLVEIGLRRIEKSAAIKANISDKLSVVTPFKDFIGNAVKASPEASIAWVGISFGLEILANPLKAPSDNRKGLTEVVSNMEWYWGLSELLLENDHAESAFEELRCRLEKDIVQLYQKLLLYQMKSVCRFFKSEFSGVAGDFIHGDDWNGQLDQIKASSAAVSQRSKEYNSQRSYRRLNDAALNAELQHKKLTEVLEAIDFQTKRQEKTQQDQIDKNCLTDLYQTNPRNDKKRIQETKGGLLRDCYDGILHHSDYKRFRADSEKRLLWIKGDPGKGKTMLMCGIVDELTGEMFTHVSCFFCQATIGSLSNATAVVRGLIWMLAHENRWLIQQYIRKDYEATGKQLFEDQNAWEALTSILKDILQGNIQDGLVLIVDALDECETDGNQLLSFIMEMSQSSSAKWILSSRKDAHIEEQIEAGLKTTVIQLELTGPVVSDAVGIYIRKKVDELREKKKYEQSTRDQLEQMFIEKSNDTFLWVALVYQELARDISRKKDPIRVLNRVPRGLNELYRRMMQQILNYEDSELREECKAILRVLSVIYGHITLKELASFVESLTPFQNDVEVLERHITLCGSFFSVLDETVYFVHQSAREYLLDVAYCELQPPGIRPLLKPAFWRLQHHVVLGTALCCLRKTLERDIYRLDDCGIMIDEVHSPTPNPLALIEYSCIHWVDHLLDSRSLDMLEDYVQRDDDLVYNFLRGKFLFWVKALSLLKNLPNRISSLNRLGALLSRSTNAKLRELSRDTFQFILRHRATIEVAPLQVYASALVFSPTGSVVRRLFQDHEPTWIAAMVPGDATWSACMQTLDGHRGRIRSLACSKDGLWLASASQDLTVRLWDAATGDCLQTYCDCCPQNDGSHIFRRGRYVYQNNEGMGSVTFSDDSRHLASVSYDGVVRIWDIARGLCIRKLECCRGEWFSIIYPSDSHWITLASPRKILNLDAVTGACLRPYELEDKERCGSIYAVAYSPDGKWLVAGSYYPDDIVMIWDAVTGFFKKRLGSGLEVPHPRAPLEGSMSFSPDSRLLASSSTNGTIKVWDMVKGVCIKTLESHQNLAVYSIAFSADNQWLVSSTFTSIEIWNVSTGTPVRSLKDYGNGLGITALSADGQRLFSTSFENTIKVWDLHGTYQQGMRNDRVSFKHRSLSCSVNGDRVASHDWYSQIEVLDVLTNTRKEIRIRENHDLLGMKFSADGKLLTLTLAPFARSNNLMTELWDVHGQSAECLRTFDSPRGIALSADGQLIASVELGCIQIWSKPFLKCIQTLDIVEDSWQSMAFSPDGRWFASASPAQRVRLWSTANYECAKTLTIDEGYLYEGEVAFSENGSWFGVAAHNPLTPGERTVQIWDTATTVHIQRFRIGQDYCKDFDKHFFTHLDAALVPLGIDILAEEPHTDIPDEMILGALQMDDNWITRGGRRLLHIPSDYRAGPYRRLDKVAVAGSFLSWVSHDKRLFWIKFSEEMVYGCAFDCGRFKTT
ncbi:hypothetical protein CNYM01_00709 [Colletotrichum nymphaeae SA-01]|uniref:Mitochondrial division protein 1 n=1 Tax=Colletotrichum nymphaeae SA-01 TaxID=1460502 RepID=A0A135TFB3_9PEZI|nr:hypothetical protein CNYM01_00709 [Colletotrichum nymphaeae SA-01]